MGYSQAWKLAHCEQEELICYLELLAAFDENYQWAIRDASNQTLSGLKAHALGRLERAYAALRFVELIVDRGALPAKVKVISRSTKEISKHLNCEYPVGYHLLKGLYLSFVDGSHICLTIFFNVDISRIAIEPNIFSSTEVPCRIVSVIDRWLELGGMKQSLGLAANMVAMRKMTADEAMTKIVEPGYQGSLIRAANKIERNFSYAERTIISKVIADNRMKSLNMMTKELRLRTCALSSRLHLQTLFEQVFSTYKKYVYLGSSQRGRIDCFVKDMANIERQIDSSVLSILGGPLIVHMN